MSGFPISTRVEKEYTLKEVIFAEIDFREMEQNWGKLLSAKTI